MSPVGRLSDIVFECRDAPTLARFWADVLGMRPKISEAEWATLVSRRPPYRLSFQSVPGYVAPEWPGSSGEQQIHLDVLVDELPQAVARVLELGGRTLSDVLDVGEDEWRIMADPEGHPFCLVTSR